MIRLSPTQLDKVLDLTESGDELGLHAQLRALGVEHHDADYRDEASNALARIIEGHVRPEGVVELLLRSAPIKAMDFATARLLAHLGADPTAARAVAELLQTALLQDDAKDGILARVRTTTPPNGEPTTVTLSDRVVWIDGGEVAIRGMPETAMVAAIGRPVRRVVSHPVLDDLRLNVMGLRWHQGGDAILGTDHRPRPIGVEELLSIRPRAASSASPERWRSGKAP